MLFCRRFGRRFPDADELLEPVGSPLEVVAALGGVLDRFAQVVGGALEALGVNCVVSLHVFPSLPSPRLRRLGFAPLIPASYAAARPRANSRKASPARVGTRPLARTT